jgi:hypothetical protein
LLRACQAALKALALHVSLIDHVAHEQLLSKVRVWLAGRAQSRRQLTATTAFAQLFAGSLWEFPADVVEAVTSFAVSLVRAGGLSLRECALAHAWRSGHLQAAATPTRTILS